MLGYHANEHGNYLQLDAIFQIENITRPANLSVVPNSYYFSRDQQIVHLANFSASYPVLASDQEYCLNGIRSYLPGIKCHVTKYSSIIRNIEYFFFGPMKNTVSKIIHRMIEAGIDSVIEKYAQYISFVTNAEVNRARIKEDEAETREVPFSMNDWKILSIFIVFVCFLTMSFIVLLVEIMFRYLAKCMDWDLWSSSTLKCKSFLVFEALKTGWSCSNFQNLFRRFRRITVIQPVKFKNLQLQSKWHVVRESIL